MAFSSCEVVLWSLGTGPRYRLGGASFQELWQDPFWSCPFACLFPWWQVSAAAAAALGAVLLEGRVGYSSERAVQSSGYSSEELRGGCCAAWAATQWVAQVRKVPWILLIYDQHWLRVTMFKEGIGLIMLFSTAWVE